MNIGVLTTKILCLYWYSQRRYFQKSPKGKGTPILGSGNCTSYPMVIRDKGGT